MKGLLTVRVLRHILVLVGPKQRLFTKDLCIKAGVIKSNSAVLVHIFHKAILQGCYWMGEPVVQLVHFKFLYQANGPASKQTEKYFDAQANWARIIEENK